MFSVGMSCWLFSRCENKPSHQHIDSTEVVSQMIKPQQLRGNGEVQQGQQWLAQPPKGVVYLYQQLWLSLFPALSSLFRSSPLTAKLSLGVYMLIDGTL